jgi:hypothetical protein
MQAVFSKINSDLFSVNLALFAYAQKVEIILMLNVDGAIVEINRLISYKS